MAKHAILSPSGASRWLNCPPSARLEQQFPDTEKEAAREGTLAHSLGELLILSKLGRIGETEFDQRLAKIQDHELYQPAMYDHCEEYAVFVMEQFASAQKHTKDALIFLEQTLDLTEHIPEGFGTGDVFIIADGILDFTDLKYGKGVPVSSVENRQMMVYGLGALRLFDYMYDIHTVRMTIYQPRIDNISAWEISVEDLHRWAEEILKPVAALAFKGEGEFNPGAHCGFCRAKAVCKANAAMQMQLAKYDFQDPALLTDEEVVDILNRAKAFTNWISSLEEYSLNAAVNEGKKWPGYKVVEGRSNRKYADEEKVAAKLQKAGFAEDVIYKKSLLGITEMEKLVGKKQFTLQLDGLIIKPPGKPTLVPATDKRPEYNSAEAAKQDFLNV